MIQIFLHEIRLIKREPRFWIPFLLPPIILVVLQIFLLQGLDPESNAIGTSLLLTVGAMLSTLSVALTADSFAGERERNTLELLLALPISPRKLFMGKWFAVLPLPIILAVIAQSFLWYFGGFQSLLILFKAWVFAISVCILISGITLWISLRAKTVRSAAQINVLWVLGVLAASQFLSASYFLNFYYPLYLLIIAITFSTILLAFGVKRFTQL